MRYLNFLFVAALLFLFLGADAQTLNLDSCRTLALKNNNELKISSKEQQIAHWERKVARTNYLPKISALGAYTRSQKEVSLLSDEQKNGLHQLGAKAGTQMQNLGQLIGQQYPKMAPILQNLSATYGTQLISSLDALGNSLVESLRTDTRNLYVGAVNVTQPIYVGGKIRAYEHITNYLEQIAVSKDQLTRQEILQETDQAYWRVVSLSNKKQLADSYVKLLEKMESDVEKMIAEGVATKADGLTVKVRVNEAEMLQTKASNGVSLAKMALCQICGLPISNDIVLSDENDEKLTINALETTDEVSVAMQNRPEIHSLTLARMAKEENVKIERSEFLPKVALTGNYLVTNPATFNGFENEFRGMWTAGIQVSIPIWHWREGAYKVNMAKSEAEIMEYKLEEAKEKITLQVNQAKFRVREAQKRLAMSEKNIEKANENLRYAKLGFSEGVIPPNQVLKAHTAWYGAKSDKIDAQIEMKLSQVALQKAMGLLNITE